MLGNLPLSFLRHKRSPLWAGIYIMAVKADLHAGFHHIVTLHSLLLWEIERSSSTDVLHIGSEADGVFTCSGLPSLSSRMVFSSSVIAFRTSSTLFACSYTCAVMVQTLSRSKIQIVRIFFIMIMLFSFYFVTKVQIIVVTRHTPYVKRVKTTRKSPLIIADERASYWKVAASYSPALHCSTIGASGLNFSVRNGKRWDPAAITTWYNFELTIENGELRIMITN